jgi:hypothetical protein
LAKVKIKNLKSVLKAVQNIFDNDLKRSKEMFDDMTKFSVDRIRAETRKGRDLSKEGAPIQDTKDSTKAIKRLIADGVITMNPPQPLFFRSKKSQVTQTGQLLDSLDGEVKPRNLEIEISPQGKREETSYRWTKSKKPVLFLNNDQITTNKGLAKSLSDRGFTFLGMDKKGVQRLRRIVLDQVRRLIKRNNMAR